MKISLIFRRLFIKVKSIFGLSLSVSDQNYQLLTLIGTSGNLTITNKGSKIVKIRYKNHSNIHARLWPHSDIVVLNQVLAKLEYKVVSDFFYDNSIDTRHLKIIDAGANVGYTSLFFLTEFPGANIISVEPDKNNLELLAKNLDSFIIDKSAFICGSALMGEADKNLVTNNDFRDGKDWSVTVAETTQETNLKSITIPDLMKIMGWDNVDILKIDIEGAERDVFRHGVDLDYLFKVKVICIEIHDEFDIRNMIYSELKKRGFILFNCNETTIAVNSNFFNPHSYGPFESI